MYVSSERPESLVTRPSSATHVPDGRNLPVDDVGLSASEPLGPLGDMDAEELRAHLHRIADWAADYRAGIEGRPIVPTVRPGDIAALTTDAMPREPTAMASLLEELDTLVMPGVVHWGHPAFLGYFGSTSNGPALLGEIAAAALNVSAMTWKTSPAATELETVVLGWVREMIGLSSAFTGVVYDTASVSVLHALAAAREGAGTQMRSRGLVGRTDLPLMRVYASDQAHSSLEKAMIMLGLGEDNVVRVRSDAEFRLDVDALREVMNADAERGRVRMAVVATVGTTSSASVDPVREIAALCREHAAWLHVDAAYGGALAVLPEGRWAMDGAELADSVVVNPHKWLFVPLDFSALYIRDPALLRSVFTSRPEYLRGDTSPVEAIGAAVRTDRAAPIDYMDYGIQLGRRFRALKAWMAFRAFGRDGIESRIREHCRLAALLARWIEVEPDVVLAAPQRMGIVCARFGRPGLAPAECDALNEHIVDAVNASGGAYLTHTRLDGRACVRVGLGNVLTTERHLAHVWTRMREAARSGLALATPSPRDRPLPPSSDARAAAAGSAGE
jgi:aromatic-L-amino-acid decarboxylase